MKVLLVSRRFPPDVVGGGEVSALLLAQALCKAGVDARVCTYYVDDADDRASGAGYRDQQGGVVVYRRRVRRRGPDFLAQRDVLYYEMARAAAPVVRDFAPDVLHALNLESIPSVAWLAWRAARPFVATVNSPWMLCFTGNGVDARGRTCVRCRAGKRLDCIVAESQRSGASGRARRSLAAALRWSYSHWWLSLFRHAALRAQALFPISDGLRNDLVALGYPPERLVTVHNPIALPASAAAAQLGEGVRQELGIPDDAFVAGYLGRLCPSKGVHRLLRALPTLPGAHALVVGKDDDRLGGSSYASELRAQVVELGLTGRVHFVDYLPSEQLEPYYRACNVVVMAGPFYEALGRMLMEASAFGVPAIATASGGIPDVVIDGKTGLLLGNHGGSEVELLSALARLQRDAGFARALGQAAQLHMATHFGAHGAASRMIAAYGGDFSRVGNEVIAGGEGEDGEQLGATAIADRSAEPSHSRSHTYTSHPHYPAQSW